MRVSTTGWRAVLTAFLVTAWSAGATAQTALSREAQAAFLQSARIVSSKDISKGVTRPVRLTLSDGTLTHDAAFSAVNEQVGIMKYKDGRTELNFVDSYKYTLAAYRLAGMLGIDDMMPVTVERTVGAHKGALTWWVDDVKFDEGERVKQNVPPPDLDAWNRQLLRMRLFAQLIADTDRNTGNILITNDWKLWMIDFTRAFRRSRQLMVPGSMTRCDRAVVEKLRGLTKESVTEQTRPFINAGDVDALMARRDAILALVDKLVADNGEAKVLY